MLRESGLERYAVNADEIQAIEPALHGAYHGGFYAPSDATGDIHKFTRGLAAACARRGAQFVYDADVQRVSASSPGMRVKWKTTDGDDDSKRERLADAIVICAGTASRRLAAMLGDRVNICPVKGYSITVHLDDPLSQGAAPWVSILDDEAKIVTLGQDAEQGCSTTQATAIWAGPCQQQLPAWRLMLSTLACALYGQGFGLTLRNAET